MIVKCKYCDSKFSYLDTDKVTNCPNCGGPISDEDFYKLKGFDTIEKETEDIKNSIYKKHKVSDSTDYVNAIIAVVLTIIFPPAGIIFLMCTGKINVKMNLHPIVKQLLKYIAAMIAVPIVIFVISFILMHGFL